MSNTLLTMITEVKKALYGEEYASAAEEKFNFAMLKKTENGLVHEELWILSNAYYDYELDKFVKIDVTHTSFGIQIQASGTYPGEAELGYDTNTGINFWRCPIWKENVNDTSYVVYKDTDYYDYNDMEENNWIGAQYDNSEFWGEKDGTWRTFGVATGWNNNFMTDSYGGITVGGAGFEIDGNGIFPFTRLTSSVYTDENNDAYYLLGILDNAYHPDQWSNWKCDSNEYGAWFFGLKYPQSNGVKDSENAKFVVMYNDMSNVDPTDNNYTIEVMDVSDWETILEVDSNSIKGMVSGTLTTLGSGTGGSGGSVDLTNYIQKSQTSGLLKNDGTVDTNTYLTSHQSLSSYYTKSEINDLIGTIDTWLVS